MYLQTLSLFFFKNYLEASFQFSKEINCIIGANGSGKTNLLDAIHYLSLTKSAFNNSDQLTVQHNQKLFMVKGTFEKDEEMYQVNCGFVNGEKKTVHLNQVPYERLSQHIGKFPVVLITPYDTDLVRGGSEVRRKYMDSIIAQTDAKFLDELMKYNGILKQRNALLKQFAEQNSFDESLLETYDDILVRIGTSIHEKRKVFTEELSDKLKHSYDQLTSHSEPIEIKYQSELLRTDFSELLNKHQQRDLFLQRTSSGIHRDDYLFVLKDKPLKKFGSQGQQKSYVISLKLAHFDFLYQHLNEKPILLLDDIFEKLDQKRIKNLIHLISEHHFGQIFITDARPEPTKNLLSSVSSDIKFFDIEHLTQE